MPRPAGVPINHHALVDIIASQHRSHAEVAVKADLSTSRLSELTTGGAKPSRPTLRKLAEALNVSTRSLERWFEGSDVGSVITVDVLIERCSLDQLERLHRMAKDALNKKHTAHLAPAEGF